MKNSASWVYEWAQPEQYIVLLKQQPKAEECPGEQVFSVDTFMDEAILQQWLVIIIEGLLSVQCFNCFKHTTKSYICETVPWTQQHQESLGLVFKPWIIPIA